MINNKDIINETVANVLLSPFSFPKASYLAAKPSSLTSSTFVSNVVIFWLTVFIYASKSVTFLPFTLSHSSKASLH